MIEELVALSYFNVIDVDRDGVLNERDLAVCIPCMWQYLVFLLSSSDSSEFTRY